MASTNSNEGMIEADGAGIKDAAGTSKARNFGTMDPARHREIASLGGKAAHANGRAPKFTSESGRVAALAKVSSAKTEPAQQG